MKLLQFLTTLLFITGIANSQTQVAKFDSLFKYLTVREDFNGNVLMADSGKVIYNKSFGYSDFAAEELLNENSMFDLASISKQFTAMAILMLMEQGKLSLDDPLSKYFNTLPYSQVTVRNLLTHTSGLPEYRETLEKYWDQSKFASNKDVIHLLSVHKPELKFEPGEKFEYSNTGYVLLASIIETVSGTTYANYLQTQIFTSLRMTRTRVLNRHADHQALKGLANGYTVDKATRTPVLVHALPDRKYLVYLDCIVGDRGVFSTTTDLLKWDRALYDTKLVKSATLDQAFNGYKIKNGNITGYGYGWGLATHDLGAGKFVYHQGNWSGFDNFIGRFIEKDKTIVVLRNISNNNQVSGIYEAYINILFNRPFQMPKIEAR